MSEREYPSLFRNYNKNITDCVVKNHRILILTDTEFKKICLRSKCQQNCYQCPLLGFQMHGGDMMEDEKPLSEFLKRALEQENRMQPTGWASGHDLPVTETQD